MPSAERFSVAEVEARLINLSGWSVLDGKLHREYNFPDFVQAFGFMSSVALVAESMDDHPEWFNVYGRVRVYLTTHDAGGITKLDFSLADRMDKLEAGI